jgi:hypothetical protein
VSYNNISSASKTLASRIWNAIKNDKQVNAIIQNPEQITFLPPKDAAERKPPQISIYLYNVFELTSMRNQPTATQNPSKQSLYLNLRYIITPITQNFDDDQTVLGKILQIFYDTPVLRGSDLQGSLKEGGEGLKVMLDQLTVDELSKVWGMLSLPYRLSVGYSVYPLKIESAVKPDTKPVVITRSPVNDIKKPIIA